METLEDDVVALLRKTLGDSIISVKASRQGRDFVQVRLGSQREALMTLLKMDEKTGLSAIIGVDLGKSIEVMYSIRIRGTLASIRTEVPKEDARMDSITDLLPGAGFHEREVADLFGVTFEGNPDQRRLILPETWPSGLYPLRKDADLTNVARVDPVENSPTTPMIGEEALTDIIIGPQHPALVEPEKFAIRVEGETVREVIPRIGYVHRGVEKAAEKRTYLQDIYLVERVCGICNSCHATCFCQAVEDIMGIEIPARAKYIRTIILEVDRLQSHLLVLGHFGHEIGYETLFQYMWRDREVAMDMMELITGNRVLSSATTIGGVRVDLSDDKIKRVKLQINEIRSRMGFYRELFQNDTSIRARVKDVGVLSKQDALKLSVVGPVARASDVGIDVRKDDPYAAYGDIPFEMITRTEGDSRARLLVRLDEIDETIRIMDYALDNLPSGPYRIRVPRIVPAGEAVSRVEAPRGELFYYVKSNGTAYPERVKIRTPTFTNIQSFPKIAEGGNIADVPVSFVSLDPCFSCTDR